MLASMTWIRPALLWTTWTTLPLAAALERPEELHGSGSAGLMPPLLAGQHLKSPAWGFPRFIYGCVKMVRSLTNCWSRQTQASFPPGLGRRQANAWAQ